MPYPTKNDVTFIRHDDNSPIWWNNAERIGSIKHPYHFARWNGAEVICKRIHNNVHHEEELAELMKLKHPNILPIYGSYVDGYDSIILMAYAPGILTDWIVKERVDVADKIRDTKQSLNWLLQIVSAVAYIQSAGVVFYGVFSRKILLTDRPMLANFNITRSEDTNGYDRHSLWGIAPELFTDKTRPTSVVFSLAMLSWELLNFKLLKDLKLPVEHPSNLIAYVKGVCEEGYRPPRIETMLTKQHRTWGALVDDGIDDDDLFGGFDSFDDVINRLVKQAWARDPIDRPPIYRFLKCIEILLANVI